MANERKADDRVPEEIERELREEEERHQQARERLVGDMAEDRNLSGSSTWETLASEEPGAGAAEEAGAGEGDANPPRTTSGGITAPKFGSAGSGGAELEPGPERD